MENQRNGNSAEPTGRADPLPLGFITANRPSMAPRISTSTSYSQHSLPDYSPSPAVPEYSENPSPSEQRLDYIPRSHRVLSASSLSKNYKGIKVTLHAQEASVSTPVYGRGGVIRGELVFQETEALLKITAQVQGRTSVTIAEGGTSQKSLFLESHTLWSISDSSETCPDTVPFRFPFPSSLVEGDRLCSPPPSYSCMFPGVPDLSVRCFYSLNFVIKSKRRFGPWNTKKSFSIPIHYHPRTCPPIPISQNILPFLDTIKSLPEEWMQVISTMRTKKNSGFMPIECHLFIPRVRIFAVSDTVPFFLQLRSSNASLRAFLSHAPLNHNVQVHHSPEPAGRTKPTIRVFLYRQIRAEIEGQRAWRTVVLGEGKICPRAPTAEFLASSVSLDDTVENLDWEGEVRCKEDVTVGGFSLGKLVVKDFIVLGLVPSSPQKSPIFEHQHAQPIRLVTDQYVDTITRE